MPNVLVVCKLVSQVQFDDVLFQCYFINDFCRLVDVWIILVIRLILAIIPCVFFVDIILVKTYITSTGNALNIVRYHVKFLSLARKP